MEKYVLFILFITYFITVCYVKINYKAMITCLSIHSTL